MGLNTNQFNVDYARQAAFNISFSTTLIEPDLTYAITIYVKGSATTDLSDYDFIDEERIYLVLNPAVAYNFSNAENATILTNSSSVTTPYQGGKLEYIDYSLSRGDYTYGEQTFQILVKGSDLLYSSDNYCSLLMYMVSDRWSSYASADIFMLNGITSVVDEQEASDAEKIISALGSQLSELIDAVENGDQEIINNILSSNQTLQNFIGNEVDNISNVIQDENEALRDLISGEPQDTSVGKEFSDVASDYSELDAEANNLVDDLFSREITVDGKTISLTMSSNKIDALKSAYSTVLDNWGGTLPYTSTLVRQHLDVWIQIFGIFIFFPLLLGLIGALLGRYVKS